jgi:DNA polymerase-3 subunit chi
MSVDGAVVTAQEIKALERVCLLFDGNDAAALDGARQQWKSLKDAGAAAEYWSEDSGAWEKKATT